MGLREAMGAGDSPSGERTPRFTRGLEPLGKDTTGRSGLENTIQQAPTTG